MTWRLRGPQDSLLWRLDALAGAGATVMAAVAIWLGVVLVWTAALATIAITVALIAGLAYGYLHVRIAVSMLEDRLRGRGEHEFDVFISYRHREHREIVDVVHRALESQGLRVWVDKRGGVPRSSWGLLLPLLRGLRYSRSVVFLVPIHAPDSGRAQGPLSDRMKELCVQPLEFAVAAWHRRFYGVELLKRPSESWQYWERRVALETKIAIFWSVTIDGGRIVPGDLDRVASSIRMKSLDPSGDPDAALLPVGSPTYPTMTKHAALAARSDHLEEDIGAAVGRGLQEVARPGREIPIEKQQARDFVGTVALIAMTAVVVVVIGAVGAALDAIKRVLLWPFVQLWTLVSRVWTRLSVRGRVTARPPESDISKR